MTIAVCLRGLTALPLALAPVRDAEVVAICSHQRSVPIGGNFTPVAASNANRRVFREQALLLSQKYCRKTVPLRHKTAAFGRKHEGRQSGDEWRQGGVEHFHPVPDRRCGTALQVCDAADVGQDNHLRTHLLQVADFAVAQAVGQRDASTLGSDRRPIGVRSSPACFGALGGFWVGSWVTSVISISIFNWLTVESVYGKFI